MATINANARQAYLLRAGTGNHSLSHTCLLFVIVLNISIINMCTIKKPGWVVVVVVTVVVVVVAEITRRPARARGGWMNRQMDE